MTDENVAAPKAAVKKKKAKPKPGLTNTQLTKIATAMEKAKKTKLQPAADEDHGTPIDQFILYGNIADLSTSQKSEFLGKLALSYGLNPMSQPFELIQDANGKLVPYAKRGAADQIRAQKKCRTEILYKGYLRVGDGKVDESVVEVEVRITEPDSDGLYVGSKCRFEDGTGCVGIMETKGQALGDAFKKAETQAKRRTTLAMYGLGLPDESEMGAASSWTTPSTLGEGAPRRALPTLSANIVKPGETSPAAPVTIEFPIKKPESPPVLALPTTTTTTVGEAAPVIIQPPVKP